MIYLLLNSDEYLASQRIAALKQAVGDPETADLNTDEVSPQTAPGDLLGQAGMMPFLSQRRLLITQGYWARLEQRMSASKDAESSAHQDAARLLTGLADLPATSDIVFWEEKGVDKRRGLWKGFTLPGKEGENRTIPGLQALIEQGVVTAEEAGTPDVRALPGWLQRYAREKRIDIQPAAVKLLTDYVGADLRRLAGELEKLAAYAAGRTITRDDVNLLVSDASEAPIWDLTDALSRRDGNQAMRALYKLRRGDANAFYLLTMIARQYRIIIKVKDAMAGGRNRPEEIARYAKESVYPVKKAQSMAQAYSFDALNQIMDRLLTADMAMKTGTDADTELDMLVAELTRRPH
ncbi:MAG: DNA polymerase III subunit delta [Caldilineaceae bacterium]|nr:DNA polymerase III subunit delta [Caldilineaceae bacterium]